MSAPLITWLRTPQTLRGRLVRLLVVRMIAFGTVVSVLLIGQVFTLSPTSAPFESEPSTVPTWNATIAAVYPDCVDAAAWPKGAPASAVVAHRYADGTTAKIDFKTAWDVTHDDSDVNDLWVLGICA
jgi:hypothetical protein